MLLREYVLFAAEKNEAALEHAEAWQGVAFTFTRYMKSHPDLGGLRSDEAADRLDDLLTEMFPEADDPWVTLLDDGNDDSEPFEDFTHCWDLIKYSLGEAPLDQALRLADEHPVHIPGHRSPRWKPYRRFLSVCRWLQFTCDGESFYVPVRKFGEILGLAIKTVSNYRQRAERQGYLVLVKEHEGRKATEYRFNLEALE